MSVSYAESAGNAGTIDDPTPVRVAIVGGGPCALYVYKHLLSGLVDAGEPSGLTVDIFEATPRLGGGMPYTPAGANLEHVTNVSCDEVPPLVTSVHEWLETLPRATVQQFDVDVDRFNEHRVLPRLLFGDYLEDQFEALLAIGDQRGVRTTVHRNTTVTDIVDDPYDRLTRLTADDGVSDPRDHEFDTVVICSGHDWPRQHEGRTPGYFDSPYPPAKLAGRYDHAVALRGSSLTAVDAIRTLARCNGAFERSDEGTLRYRVNETSPDFRIVMHSRNGLLPCVRVHTERAQLGSAPLLPDDVLGADLTRNDGFLSLDFLFERNFKTPLRERDPKFYARIAGMTVEEFVDAMLALRESFDPFQWLALEYAEAKRSIRREQPVYWKEQLSALSFAMNYPAKHMSAEDMIRHQRTLMPLISIVIAFVPQSSCEELLAMHDAGRLEVIAVGEDNRVEADADGGAMISYRDGVQGEVRTHYSTFVDCIGQPRLSASALPFPSLVRDRTVTPARLRFRDPGEAVRLQSEGCDTIEQDERGDYHLRVSGIAIDDAFRVMADGDVPNPRIHLLAVPFIGGYNPDYSGLDFCDTAGGKVARTIVGERSMTRQ